MRFPVAGARYAVQGVGDDILDRSDRAERGIDHAVRVVGVVDPPDASIDPDLVGDADDVIDDIDEIVLEAA